MPAPREQGGGASEASRLLQEGLELLDARSREVDALVEQAEERARQVTAEAEQRAQEITAEAERHRMELEEQIAALRAEVAAVREELAELRATPAPKGGRGRTVAAAAVPAAAIAAVGEGAAATAEPISSGSTDSDTTPLVETPAGMPAEAADMAEAAEAAGTPRWGRPSTIAGAQQAIRTRASRPRWLPPWLPFLIGCSPPRVW